MAIVPGPTRWGNQLNGNSPPYGWVCQATALGPTRWGNQLNGNPPTAETEVFELSLGPTRWGNQLNGNTDYFIDSRDTTGWPHSLGQSVEWKHFLIRNCCMPFKLKTGPTRWGNQLNGNSIGAFAILAIVLEAPLAGAIS